MPRLQPSLLKKLHQENCLLPLLLRVCRTPESARNELRWLREHAISISKSSYPRTSTRWRLLLERYCAMRSIGRPLQYIIGSHPFGDLEILCEMGVLIPRTETEAWTTHLSDLLLTHRLGIGPSKGQSLPSSLRILDLCTGTGCISLLLHSLLSPHINNLKILGVDLASKAIALAKKNLQWNVTRGRMRLEAESQIRFLCTDIFAKDSDRGDFMTSEWDIIVSNPPYISPAGFFRDTSRSVRNWEPKLALVPHILNSSRGMQAPTFASEDLHAAGDTFYPHLLAIAAKVKAKMLVLETADLAQATRVTAMACKSRLWDEVEIWRDWPGQASGDEAQVDTINIEGKNIDVRGDGNGRTVVCSRKGLLL